MKNKSALKQSVQSLRFLAVAAPASWILWYFWRPWPVVIAALILTFSLAVDAVNVWHIRRRAARDPAFLEEKVPDS